MRAWAGMALVMCVGCADYAKTAPKPETNRVCDGVKVADCEHNSCVIGFVTLNDSVRCEVANFTDADKRPGKAPKVVGKLRLDRSAADGKSFQRLTVTDAATLCAITSEAVSTTCDNASLPQRTRAGICPNETYPLLPVAAWKCAMRQFAKKEARVHGEANPCSQFAPTLISRQSRQ